MSVDDAQAVDSFAAKFSWPSLAAIVQLAHCLVLAASCISLAATSATHRKPLFPVQPE